MQKLLIEDDEGKTVVVPLIRDEITIGRQEGNTIRLSEQNVSRRHARLVRRQGALLLEDLSSYNGTKLNGAVLSASASLKDGDVILIGDYRMAIKEERPSAALAVAAHAPVASAAASSSAQAGAAVPPAAEVQDAIEAQPTIPLHSLVDEASALDSASRPPRLVIVGRFMAGREFMLDRPSLVIGRTSENDIVIEHKSISRHHARIVREGNQYYAVDLESANGVRVNGVDHDRVLLSPGDQIELGQVQLRFVTEEGGGELEPGLGRLSKGKIYGMVGGGAVVVALVLAFALSGGRSRPRRAPAPPAPPIVAQPLPPPPPPQETLADLLAAAKAAQASEKWDEALAAANKACAAAPDSNEAAELRKLAEDEKGNAERFAALKEAADKSNFEAVLRGAGEIPETSVYKERASVLEKSARAEYVKLHVDAASGKASVGACDEAKSEAELVLAVDRNNKTAHWIVGRCAVLAKKASPKPEAKKPAQTPKPVVGAQSKPGGSLPAQAEPSADPDKLIQQAREAWLRGQYILAIDSARRALRAKPDLTSAYQIIAICSCSLHDSDAALRAYEKLDERNRQLVRSACQKNGISF
jgi:pSer/pThr/pTyr-binding forkhead associated (FHA) protein/tetratricopeptide (TPR) repeat protein